MAVAKQTDTEIGVVVIGRNEGERLRTCLQSVVRSFTYVVYVDSASSDNSVDIAHSAGANRVLILSPDKPMSAARARNEGFYALKEQRPNVQLVQFVDGDCEVASGWLPEAIEFLSQDEEIAVVCGLRRERFPAASPYNAMCDIEWNGKSGDVASAGGDFLIRSESFELVNGFKEHLIAGEDPEFCYRVKRIPAKIWRLPIVMTLHDADMSSFKQWRQRSIRTGYAYAARAYEHLFDGNRYCWRENLAIVFWTTLLPTILLLSLISPWLVLLLAIYPLQYIRMKNAVKEKCEHLGAAEYAGYLLLGRFLQFFGQLQFVTRLLSGGPDRLIEYK